MNELTIALGLSRQSPQNPKTNKIIVSFQGIPLNKKTIT